MQAHEHPSPCRHLSTHDLHGLSVYHTSLIQQAQRSWACFVVPCTLKQKPATAGFCCSGASPWQKLSRGIAFLLDNQGAQVARRKKKLLYIPLMGYNGKR